MRLADTSGKTDRQIERDLGLYQGAIRRWRDELEADPIDAFPGTGHQKPLEEENRCLRRDLDIAREERDILNKVVAIFSKIRIGRNQLRLVQNAHVRTLEQGFGEGAYAPKLAHAVILI